MKVVQINAVYGTGSTGRIAQDIHEFLVRSGDDSYIAWGAVCKGSTDRGHFFQVGNVFDHKMHAVLYRLMHDQGFHSWAATKRLCRKLKEIQPDVVHLHNLHSNYISLPVLFAFLKSERIPTVVTLHDCWMYTGYCYYYHGNHCDGWKNQCRSCPATSHPFQKRIEKMYQEKLFFFENGNCAIVGVSNWITEDAKQSLLGHAPIVRTVYNWIDTDLFHPHDSKASVFSHYQIPTEKKLVIGVSQGWSARKGLHEFERIAELCPEAFVLLVGNGDQVRERENLKCIGFTQSREELIEIYSAADLFVNPSRMETFGLVTAEAMACGAPVIAYDNTALHEIVGDGCGYLIEDGNGERLAETVHEYLQGNLPEPDRERCIDWVRSKLDKERQICKYLVIYKELISRKC